MQSKQEGDIKKSAYDETKDNEYNFGIGHPNFALNLPPELIMKCLSQHIDKENSNYYSESTDYGLCEGSWYFRSNLADWLNKLNSMNVDENDKKYSSIYGSNIVLTTGASQSMELLLIHLKRLKNKININCENIVLCEDPSYYLFPNIVETANCKLLPIPFINNTNTLNFEYLENILIKYGNDIICFYIIPSHQNPLGISYTLNDKIKLIKLCQKYKLHLIADEVYNTLSFDKNIMMIPFISSIEQTIYAPNIDDNDDEKKDNNNTFYCHSISSFSKIIGPGFRIGWIYSGNDEILELIANHGSIKSGGCMTQFIPSIINYLLNQNSDNNDDDMTNHLIKVRNELNKNCKTLCETIKKYDTENIIKFIEPKGGYFMWLQLPMEQIKIISDKKCKVKYFNGIDLSSTFGPISKNIQFINNHNHNDKQKYFQQCIRFCFAYLDQQQIRDGAHQFVKYIYNQNNDKQ